MLCAISTFREIIVHDIPPEVVEAFVLRVLIGLFSEAAAAVLLSLVVTAVEAILVPPELVTGAPWGEEPEFLLGLVA